MEEGKSLPRLCVGMADWLHPAGNSALEKMPKENGNILCSFFFVTTLFRKKKGEVSAEKPQRELGNHLFPKLEKKKEVQDENCPNLPICILSCPNYTKSHLREWL